MVLLSCPLIESIMSTGTKSCYSVMSIKDDSLGFSAGQQTWLNEKGNSVLKAPWKHQELPVVNSDHGVGAPGAGSVVGARSPKSM